MNTHNHVLDENNKKLQTQVLLESGVWYKEVFNTWTHFPDENIK